MVMCEQLKDPDLEERKEKNQVKHEGVLQECQELPCWKESDNNNAAYWKVISTYLISLWHGHYNFLEGKEGHTYYFPDEESKTPMSSAFLWGEAETHTLVL